MPIVDTQNDSFEIVKQWKLAWVGRIAFCIKLLSGSMFAQDTMPRFEIGPLVSWINLDPEESGFNAQNLHRGAGGQFTLNLRRSFGIDAEIVGYPNSPGRVIWRAAGNLKVTARKEETARINLFGIAGIGLMKQTRFLGSGLGFLEATSHGPLFNIGGGLEYVPDRRIALRFGVTNSLFRPPHIPELTNETRQKVDLNLSLMLRP